MAPKKMARKNKSQPVPNKNKASTGGTKSSRKGVKNKKK